MPTASREGTSRGEHLEGVADGVAVFKDQRWPGLMGIADYDVLFGVDAKGGEVGQPRRCQGATWWPILEVAGLQSIANLEQFAISLRSGVVIFADGAVIVFFEASEYLRRSSCGYKSGFT